MSKNAIDTNKTEELIVTAPTAELAEKVRGYIIDNYPATTWLFVYRQVDGTALVRATNELGGRLSEAFLEALQLKAAEIAGVAPPEKVSVPKKPEAGEPSASGSSAIQEP